MARGCSSKVPTVGLSMMVRVVLVPLPGRVARCHFPKAGNKVCAQIIPTGGENYPGATSSRRWDEVMKVPPVGISFGRKLRLLTSQPWEV